jgi:hypothetical protein
MRDELAHAPRCPLGVVVRLAPGHAIWQPARCVDDGRLARRVVYRLVAVAEPVEFEKATEVRPGHVKASDELVVAIADDELSRGLGHAVRVASDLDCDRLETTLGGHGTLRSEREHSPHAGHARRAALCEAG